MRRATDRDEARIVYLTCPGRIFEAYLKIGSSCIGAPKNIDIRILIFYYKAAGSRRKRRIELDKETERRVRPI